MLEFVLNNWSMVKISATKEHKKLFYNLRSMQQKLVKSTADPVQQIAEELKLDGISVLEMQHRMSSSDVLDIEDHDVAEECLEQQIIAKDSYDRLSALCSEAFLQLDRRSRDVMQSRFFVDPKISLADLATKYQISLERVRQIEKEAIKRVKVLVRKYWQGGRDSNPRHST